MNFFRWGYTEELGSVGVLECQDYFRVHSQETVIWLILLLFAS
jgi:hypothetical protein